MNIRPSDLGLLVALNTLLEERNVTRAAEKLNISQPAMSAQLARLRDLFDDQLLVISGRQMLPTARALELQAPLRDLIDTISKVVSERQRFAPATSTRTFRIIAADYLQLVVVLPLLEAVRHTAPGIQLHLLPFDAATAWSKLEQLEADLVITWPNVIPPEARAIKLCDDDLCMVQRIGHPRGTAKLSVEALCALDHVVISHDGVSLRGLVDEELDKLGQTRRIVASAVSFLAAPAMVAQTDMVASMPRRLAKMMPDLVEIFDLPLPAIRFEFFAAWHPRMHNDSGHQWLRNQMVASV